MKDACPHCGQRMLERLGVLLSPKQADIFDMIARCRDIETVSWVLFPDKTKTAARKCLHVHVHHINNLLAETDYEIRGDRDGFYVLRKRLEVAA